MTPEAKEPLSLERAADLLRRWQLNEWELDRRMTKKAMHEQRRIVSELLTALCQRKVTSDEIDQVFRSLN